MKNSEYIKICLECNNAFKLIIIFNNMKELTIELPGECALDCVHCSHSLNEELQMDHPEFEEEELLDMVRDTEISKVRISGGEPFLIHEPGMFTILEEAKRLGKQTEVLSSVVYSRAPSYHKFIAQPIPEQLFAGLRELVDKICFSLYGNEEVHDNITRTEGSFRALSESVRRARKYGVNLGFNFVPLRMNVHSMDDVASYVRYQQTMTKKEVDLGILRFIRQGGACLASDYALNKDETNKLRARIPYIAAKYSIKINMGCSFAEKGCRAKIGKKVIMPGKIRVCSALKYVEAPEIIHGKCACEKLW